MDIYNYNRLCTEYGISEGNLMSANMTRYLNGKQLYVKHKDHEELVHEVIGYRNGRVTVMTARTFYSELPIGDLIEGRVKCL